MLADRMVADRMLADQALADQTSADHLLTAFRRSGERTFVGFVADPADPQRRFAVELLVDGVPMRLARAEGFVAELARDGLGDGCYGFTFVLPADAVGDAASIEARLANVGTAIGAAIAIRLTVPAEEAGAGRVGWLGGLRFGGWLAGASVDDARVEATIDGIVVAEAPADRWAHRGGADADKPVRAFDLHLPAHFADGRVRRVRITADGAELTGSPVAFAAFADGLEAAIARLGDVDGERLRGEMFDRLMPAAMPLADYARWRQRFPLPAAPAAATAVAVLLVGDGDVEATLASLDAQHHGEWLAAALPGSDPVSFDPVAAAEFLAAEATHCGIVVLTLAGAQLDPGALGRIVDAFARWPKAPAVYGDVDLVAGDAAWPLALPAFSYERMLEQGYCALLFALPRAAAEHAVQNGACDLYRVFNRQVDGGPENGAGIVHIPGALAALPTFNIAAAARTLAAATADHLARRDVAAQVATSDGASLPAVRVSRRAAGATTIVIPVRDRAGLLRTCLDSIAPAVERTGADILVVDNGSIEPEMLVLLDEIAGGGATVLHSPGPFNFARLNNLAAAAARGDFLCLLNNDVEAVGDGWLGEMLGRIAEPDVGAVGALLLWPSGVVQHGGVVLGPSLAATHAFNDRIRGDPGYGDLLRVAAECGAVTAACLITRRSDYRAVGGMDEARFPVNFNDVDYCLKLRALGRRIVVTPHATLLHAESLSRGADDRPDRAARFGRELRNLRARWAEALAADPFYSPALSLDPVPFSALAWPPRPMDPRIAERPAAREVPPGF
jgi:GT2 family glycosyltransferase